MLAYIAPTTVDEAVSALAAASGVVKVLSGGTDLLVQLRSGRAKPDLIIDISLKGSPTRRAFASTMAPSLSVPQPPVQRSESAKRYGRLGPVWSRPPT